MDPVPVLHRAGIALDLIAVKDHNIRRDLQCYARMLNLMALYDAGLDFNIDYQIRSVYSFIVKMKDMTEMKDELLSFFKSLGNINAIDCNYASENGVKALKSIIKLAQSPAFVNGSSASNATNLGAIVDGTWDAGAVQAILGENYAAVKLPTVDGYQLGGFGGFKMLGVKPQTDDAKLAACDALALFLSSGEVQLARYDAVKWGPSNLKAQASDAVQANASLAALAKQNAYGQPQGQIHGSWWDIAKLLGADAKNAADEAALQLSLIHI